MPAIGKLGGTVWVQWDELRHVTFVNASNSIVARYPADFMKMGEG
jgi:hypothetical protein